MDGNDLQVMLLGDLHQLGNPGHRSVFLDDLANDRRRISPAHPGQIDGRLGVPRPPQDAAFLGDQRENVSRSAEILRTGLGIDQGANRLRPLVGGDPRGRADVVHGDGEGSSVVVGVVVNHRREIQLPGALLGDRHADEPPAVGDHEIDHLGGGLLRQGHQIPFVFPVLVVNHDDHVSLHQFVNRFFDGMKTAHFYRLPSLECA